MRATPYVLGVALAAGVVALASTGAALAATSASTVHTVTVTSETTSMTQFGPRFVNADKDVSGGKVIGNDILSATVTYTAKVHKISGSFAIALNGGEIYAHITGNPDTNVLRGKLSGGAGQYKGVTGTISGKPVPGSSTKEHVVIKYRRG